MYSSPHIIQQTPIFQYSVRSMVVFTSRKIERAKLSSNIYNNIGLKTEKNFKNMASTKIISNFPISVAYQINSENIYWPSMASLKGKPTRGKPRPVIKNDTKIPIEIYRNNSNVEL